MTNAKDITEHLTDLRVAYLENMLDPEERSSFEAHLKTCSQCAEELEAMKRWVRILECNKEVFCPEPWAVFDQWRNVESADGAIASHAERCPTCAQDFADFENARGQAMPASLWTKMIGERREVRRPRASWWDHLHEMLTDLLAMVVRPPALALATVAAIALAFVFLYPAATHRTIVGLGSTQWGPSHLERNLMGPATPPASGETQRVRVAVVLLFQGFEQPLPQERVEELYEGLRPGPEMEAHFEFVTPAQLKEAVKEERIGTSTPEKLVRGLREVFGVSFALLVTIRPVKGHFAVSSEMIDAHNGKSLATIEIRDVAPNQLPSFVNSATGSLLGLRQ